MHCCNCKSAHNIFTLKNPILGLIEVTQRCNLNCPICYRRQKNLNVDCDCQEPSVEKIIDTLKKIKIERPNINPTIAFTGGEPTLRDDLPELIRKTRELGFKRTEVMTNGMRFAHDFEYLKEIKRSGLSQMGLQFDGFDDEAYKIMRGESLLESKEKVLANLKKVKQPTILAACIMNGINDTQIGKIFQYSVNNKDFVEHINFQTYMINTGNNVCFDKSYYLNKEQIISHIEKETKGKIKRGDFFPPSYIKPVPEFIECMTNKEQKQFFPLFHEDCNLTTYVYVTLKKDLMSVNKSLDIDSFLHYLSKLTEKVNKKPSFTNKTRVFLSLTVKTMKMVKNPIFREMLIKSILKKEFDPLDNLDKMLMISCEDYMDEKQYSEEKNDMCGLFFIVNENVMIPFCQYNLQKYEE